MGIDLRETSTSRAAKVKLLNNVKMCDDVALDLGLSSALDSGFCDET